MIKWPFWPSQERVLAPVGLDTEMKYWTAHIIARFLSVLLVYIVAESIVIFLLSYIINVTCNVKGIDSTMWHWIVKITEEISL